MIINESLSDSLVIGESLSQIETQVLSDSLAIDELLVASLPKILYDILEIDEQVCLCINFVRYGSDSLILNEQLEYQFADPIDPRNSDFVASNSNINFSAVFDKSFHDSVLLIETLTALLNDNPVDVESSCRCS